MASGDGIVVAKAWVQITPTMQGSQKTIATELTGVTEPASKEAGEKSGKKFGESLAKGLKTASAVIAGAMATATAGAVATGKAFVNSAKEVASYGDTVAKESQKMNLSAQGYQELSYIMQRNGSSIESLKTGMLKLTKAAEANDDAFKALGISQEQLKAMSPEETFNATIKSLQDMENVEQRTVLANKLFGKGAVELAPLLNQTSEATEALRKQVHDLGGVMSDEAVKDSEAFKDEMLNMQTSLDGMKRNMISQFLPGMTTVMQGLSKVFAGDSSGIGQISSGLSSVIAKVTEMAPQFLSLASTIIMNTLNGFAPMLPSVVSTIFSFITQAILSITALIPQLTPILTDGIRGICSALFTALPVIISALIEMAKELVGWLASGDNTKTFIDGVISLISVIAESLADALPILLPALVNIIGQVASALTDPKNIQTILTSVLYIIGAVVVALVKAIPELGGAVVKILSNLGTMIKEWGGSLLGRIGSFFVGLWNDVSTKLGTFINSVMTKLGSLPKQAIELGKDLIQGFIDGIGKLAKKAVDTVKSLGSKVVSGLKGILGIHSPSRVFKELGEMTGEGFRIGYESSFADAESDMLSSMEGLTGNMTATVNANGVTSPSEGGNTYNGGAVTINVYGAEGQNINDLANVIALKLEEMTKRRSAVYA